MACELKKILNLVHAMCSSCIERKRINLTTNDSDLAENMNKKINNGVWIYCNQSGAILKIADNAKKKFKLIS